MNATLIENFLFVAQALLDKGATEELLIEKTIFLALAVTLLSVLLRMAWVKKHETFATLFFLCLVSIMGFYLFQFGMLGEFSVKGLSGSAQFIKQQVTEAKADVDQIKTLADESVDNATKIKDAASAIDDIRKQVALTQQQLQKEQNRVSVTTNAIQTRLDATTKNLREFDAMTLVTTKMQLETDRKILDDDIPTLTKALNETSALIKKFPGLNPAKEPLHSLVEQQGRIENALKKQRSTREFLGILIERLSKGISLVETSTNTLIEPDSITLPSTLPTGE